MNKTPTMLDANVFFVCYSAYWHTPPPSLSFPHPKCFGINTVITLLTKNRQWASVASRRWGEIDDGVSVWRSHVYVCAFVCIPQIKLWSGKVGDKGWMKSSNKIACKWAQQRNGWGENIIATFTHPSTNTHTRAFFFSHMHQHRTQTCITPNPI